MKNKVCIGMVGVLLLAASVFADAKKQQERLENSGNVIKEILNVPDNVPQDLLDKARCVVVLPSVVKFAIGIGGSYGRGVMTCRTGENFTGPWGAPSIIALEGGSFGLQLGGQATDFVLLLMTPRSAEAVLSSKVKLGADASAARGGGRFEIRAARPRPRRRGFPASWRGWSDATSRPRE